MFSFIAKTTCSCVHLRQELPGLSVRRRRTGKVMRLGGVYIECVSNAPKLILDSQSAL